MATEIKGFNKALKYDTAIHHAEQLNKKNINAYKNDLIKQGVDKQTAAVMAKLFKDVHSPYFSHKR